MVIKRFLASLYRLKWRAAARRAKKAPGGKPAFFPFAAPAAAEKSNKFGNRPPPAGVL
jgi:hypothetical protein